MPCVKLGESLDVVPTSVAGAECQLCCTQWPITVFFAPVNIKFLVKIFRRACKLFATIALELKVTLKTLLCGSNRGDSSILSQIWRYIIPIFPPQTLPSRFLKTFLRWVLSFFFSPLYLNISSQTSQGDDYLPTARNQPGVFYMYVLKHLMKSVLWLDINKEMPF